DIAAARSDRILERYRGDDAAHCAFGNFVNGLLGVLDLEQVELRLADVPAHRISEIDDVLVASQDEILARGIGGTAVDRADLLDVDLLHGIDRRRQREVDAGPHGADVIAETSDDATFLRADAMKAGEKQPDHDDDHEAVEPVGPAIPLRQPAAEPHP